MASVGCLDSKSLEIKQDNFPLARSSSIDAKDAESFLAVRTQILVQRPR